MKLSIPGTFVYVLLLQTVFVNCNHGSASKTLSDFLTLNSDDKCDGDDVAVQLPPKHSTTKEIGKKVEIESKKTEEEEEDMETAGDNLVNFTRIRLPQFKNVSINKTFTTVLPGDVDVDVTVLSTSPFIFGKCFPSGQNRRKKSL